MRKLLGILPMAFVVVMLCVFVSAPFMSEAFEPEAHSLVSDLHCRQFSDGELVDLAAANGTEELDISVIPYSKKGGGMVSAWPENKKGEAWLYASLRDSKYVVRKVGKRAIIFAHPQAKNILVLVRTSYSAHSDLSHWVLMSIPKDADKMSFEARFRVLKDFDTKAFEQALVAGVP